MQTVIILGLGFERFFLFFCNAATHSLSGSNVDDCGRFRGGAAAELGNKFFSFRATLEGGDLSLLHATLALAVSSRTYTN